MVYWPTWRKFHSVFNGAIITRPPRESEQTGAIERNVGQLNIPIAMIESGDSGLPIREVHRRAFVCKNNSHVPNIFYIQVRIVFGRIDCFLRLLMADCHRQRI